MGSDTAKLWMLVVSDFQCPFCKRWHEDTWEAIRREFVAPGKLRVAYVHFPLGIHPNAKPAAVASMCAAVQGRFWQMADRLFAEQDRWKDLKDPAPAFAAIARSAGVDQSRLQACVRNGDVTAIVEADQARMTRAAAQSTPTFFIGSSIITGAQPFAEFRRVITAELARIPR